MTHPSGAGPPTTDPSDRSLGLSATLSLVVASMIGTGVFVTLGAMVEPVPSASGIVVCWLVGGLAASCGALAYAELATAFPESGGEAMFLSRLMHPALGFLSAFVSLIVGFAAPLAALALAFGKYLNAIGVPLPPGLSGAILVVSLSAINAWRVRAGAGLQTVATALKVFLVAGLAVLGLAHGEPSSLAAGRPLGDVALTPGFAVGLLLVSFSYTGWNAAAYVAGEVREPERVLPRALLLGTGLVTLLYVALNAAFLMAAPLEALAETDVVGHVAGVAWLGPAGGRIVDAIIAGGLVSTVGALVVTGPRVYEAVGRQVPRLSFLARRREGGGPWVAVALQAVLALVMMSSADVRQLLEYMGFTLALFAALGVSAVFVLRRRGPVAPFRMIGYPVTPLLFLALMGWMIVSAVLERGRSVRDGLITLAVGLLVWVVVRERE